ncbi:unnamed protein product, partial [Enterobius vermicularis]|uniref:CLDND1 n=1 Tax=Enterobius vermicularis TaxID=51028 RepID=A0A0N4UYQ5_ENTVE
ECLKSLSDISLDFCFSIPLYIIFLPPHQRPPPAASPSPTTQLETEDSQFFQDAQQVKTTPNSQGTVLTMAGLFVVGVILMLSGVIVLCQHSETLFIITGCLFLGTGFTMLFVCALLQRKNITKCILHMNSDYYFANPNTTHPWNILFEEPRIQK